MANLHGLGKGVRAEISSCALKLDSLKDISALTPFIPYGLVGRGDTGLLDHLGPLGDVVLDDDRELGRRVAHRIETELGEARAELRVESGLPVAGAGPMLVRRWTGSAWEAMGGDLGIRTPVVQMRVTPTGLPLVGYRQGNSPARRVDALGWDGTAWRSVPSPNLETVDVIGFALGLASSGQAYVALTQRDPADAFQLAMELQVRTFVP